MITKKLHFPKFFLLLITLVVLFGCTKKRSKLKDKKSNTAYQIYIDYAEEYFANSKYNSAFIYYNKSRLACNPYQDSAKIVYSLLKMATIQQIQGDYASSETSATEAVSFFQQNSTPEYKCYTFNILGINYGNLFDYDSALNYYNQAYDLAESDLQKIVLKNNIAVIYLDQKKYQQAISVLLPLIKKKVVVKSDENYARILDNLGYCYFRTGNTQSLPYLNKSLKIRQRIQDNFGLTKSYIHLSEFHKDRDAKLSYTYSKLAYEKATKTNNVEDRLKSLTLLMQNNIENDSKKNSAIYLRINDSLNQARQKAKNQFAKIKYDSTKEKNENLQLKAQKAENALELEQQKNKNFISNFITFLGIITVIFLYYFFRNKNRKEKALAVYNSETRISKKLHDELANDVYQTIAFAETHDLQNPEKKERLLGNLDKIYARTRNISRENSKIETGVNYEEELKQMISGYSNHLVQVIIKDNGEINWMKIQSEKKIALYRVLQELMVNMKKHSQCSFVILQFEDNDKFIEITYSDNGIGINDDLILKNGLNNVESRIHTIGGTITFDKETSKGFKVQIAIPK